MLQWLEGKPLPDYTSAAFFLHFYQNSRVSLAAAKSILYMQDPDHSASYQAMADTKPSLLLKGETPRLIDEW